MTTYSEDPSAHSRDTIHDLSNGGAMAAVLAAGIGSFAMGLFVILNEAGIFSPPVIYGPAGGVSGRTTFAALAWLIAWGVLHLRWKQRSVNGSGVFTVAIVLVALGLVATFPPVWGLLPS